MGGGRGHKQTNEEKGGGRSSVYGSMNLHSEIGREEEGDPRSQKTKEAGGITAITAQKKKKAREGRLGPPIQDQNKKKIYHCAGESQGYNPIVRGGGRKKKSKRQQSRRTVLKKRRGDGYCYLMMVEGFAVWTTGRKNESKKKGGVRGLLTNPTGPEGEKKKSNACFCGLHKRKGHGGSGTIEPLCGKGGGEENGKSLSSSAIIVKAA